MFVIVGLLYWNQRGAATLAFALFIFTALTDWWDGMMARRQGIVTIHVSPSRVGDSELECALKRRFGLQAVYVAPARVSEPSVASRVVALMQ